MSKEFRDYTEQRIGDMEKLSSFFPEIYAGIDFQSFKDAYAYEDYLERVKQRLEKIFERELSWYETDMFQSTIKGHIASKLNPSELFGQPTPENRIKYSMLVTDQFNKQLGIEMSDEEFEKLASALITAMNNQTRKAMNEGQVREETPE